MVDTLRSIFNTLSLYREETISEGDHLTTANMTTQRTSLHVVINVPSKSYQKKIPPPTLPKPKAKKFTAEESSELSFPPPPPEAFEQKTDPMQSANQGAAQDELDKLTDLLMKNLENTDDPDFFGMCYKCGGKISGSKSGCKAMDNQYHVTCFVCDTCGCQLLNMPFYQVEDKVICEPDYMNTLENCVVCKNVITDRILRALNSAYHPQCFACMECEKCLDGIHFTLDANDNIHCVDCYYKKYSPRCFACNDLILPEEGKDEIVRVVSMEKDFHVSCFKCEECGLLLSSEEEGHGCYPIEGHLLCLPCNGKRVKELTRKSGSTQHPLTTEL